MPKIVDKDAMRAVILAAAMRVLRTKGLHAAKMADIAREAGLAKGTLYLYFASKQEMVAALVRGYFEEAEAQFAAMPLPHSQDALIANLRHLLTLPQAQSDALGHFVELFGPGFGNPGIRDEMIGFFDRIAAHLDAQLTAVGFSGPPLATARSLVAMMDGLMLHAALFASATTATDAMTEAFLAMVSARLSA